MATQYAAKREQKIKKTKPVNSKEITKDE